MFSSDCRDSLKVKTKEVSVLTVKPEQGPDYADPVEKGPSSHFRQRPAASQEQQLIGKLWFL